MDIRPLADGDIDALCRFVTDSYDDYPLAMWFDERPQKEQLERMFYSKMKGSNSGAVADFVAEQAGIILAECEIVRTSTGSGVVGILVRKEYSGKGLGSKLLDRAMDAAKEIGIYKLRAEVMADNKDAIHFFMINGFAPVGTAKTKKSGEQRDVVILEKKVK